MPVRHPAAKPQTKLAAVQDTQGVQERGEQHGRGQVTAPVDARGAGRRED